MKRCFKCGAAKPLAEFYKHPMMGDGHLNKCKDCTRVDVRANRASKREHYRAYDRRRFQEDTKRRSDQYETSRRMAERHPERKRARSLTRSALKSGRLVKQPCEVCGAVKVEAHHDDYTQPLVVRWLCVDHHNAAHHPLPF